MLSSTGVSCTAALAESVWAAGAISASMVTRLTLMRERLCAGAPGARRITTGRPRAARRREYAVHDTWANCPSRIS